MPTVSAQSPAIAATYRWFTAAKAVIPNGASPNGREAAGESLYVARAQYQGGLHPGKVRPGFDGAHIPYGGHEISVPDYEVLLDPGVWVKASGGAIPDGAVECGHELDGTPLYVARAQYQGGLHPGKARHGFTAANIPYGGLEVKVADYEVLVQRGNGPVIVKPAFPIIVHGKKELNSHTYSETTANVSASGGIFGNTHTWTDSLAVGAHAVSALVLFDANHRVLWQQDLVQCGVGPLLEIKATHNRTCFFNTTVPVEALNQTRYAAIDHHESGQTIFDNLDLLKTIATVVATVVSVVAA